MPEAATGRSQTLSSRVSPVFHAALNNDVDAIKTVILKKIDKPERNGRTPVMAAAMHGQIKSLELLLGFGAQADRMDSEGNTALHECCFCNNLTSVDTLLNYGANVHVSNNEGDTPLHIAAYECSPEAVQILLEFGADKKSLNKKKQTPAQKLQLSGPSRSHNPEKAEKIIKMLEEWNEKTARRPKTLKAVKEETLEGILEVEKNISFMNKQVDNIEVKVEDMKKMLKAREESETKALTYEKKVIDILEALKIPPEFVKSKEDVGETLSKLRSMTSNIFENLCQQNEFNDRAFARIFFKISDVIGKTPDLWKELGRHLFADYSTSFVNDLLNTITINHSVDGPRAHECLMHWKIFVGTYVDKIEPLKDILKGMGFEGMEKLCGEIDLIIQEFDKMTYEEPTGSLTDRNLSDLSKKLGNKWKEIGFQLDFTQSEIENIEANIPLQEERSRHMLIQWVQRENGFNRAKLGRLSEALKRVGRVDLAATLTLTK